jgi:hypothetical protein
MGTFWWIFPALVTAVAVLTWLVWPHFRRRRDAIRLERARRQFHLRREWLEADFLTLASARGKPRGLTWRDVEFSDEAVFATDRSTGELRAFVGVMIGFEAVAGGEMEDNPNVENIRLATAVFLFDDRHWQTEGRALFNLNPLEAIDRFQHELQIVDGAS